MSSLSQYLSNVKLLKNDVSPLGMEINAATRLYGDTTKREQNFDKKETMKKIKIAK